MPYTGQTLMGGWEMAHLKYPLHFRLNFGVSTLPCIVGAGISATAAARVLAVAQSRQIVDGGHNVSHFLSRY